MSTHHQMNAIATIDNGHVAPRSRNHRPQNAPQQQQTEAKKEKILAERFKTQMCRNYERKGACPYENKCMFAHGDHDMRTPEMNVRDGLFTEESIEAFRRAQRLLKKRANQAARQAAAAAAEAEQLQAAAAADGNAPPPSPASVSTNTNLTSVSQPTLSAAAVPAANINNCVFAYESQRAGRPSFLPTGAPHAVDTVTMNTSLTATPALGASVVTPKATFSSPASSVGEREDAFDDSATNMMLKYSSRRSDNANNYNGGNAGGSTGSSGLNSPTAGSSSTGSASNHYRHNPYTSRFQNQSQVPPPPPAYYYRQQ